MTYDCYSILSWFLYHGFIVNELYEICYQVCIQGEWPQDFLEAIIIPIVKKNGAQECIDFRMTCIKNSSESYVAKARK